MANMMKNHSSGDAPESEHRQSLQSKDSAQSDDFRRQLSMISPDKGSVLMNYSLDSYKNSIWENFLGSQVQFSVTISPDGSESITNQNVDKLGPIQLRIEEGNLYQAWEKSRYSEIEGFKGDVEGQ